MFSWLWATLGRTQRDPNPLIKFGLGLIQVGAGFFVLVWGAAYADAAFKTPVIFLALAYLLHTTGELCLSPVGLSEMTKLAPARMISTLMAVWFMASSAAQFLAGLVAQSTAAETVGRQVLDPGQALLTYVHTFLIIGLWGAGAVRCCCWPSAPGSSTGPTASTIQPTIRSPSRLPRRRRLRGAPEGARRPNTMRHAAP